MTRTSLALLAAVPLACVLAVADPPPAADPKPAWGEEIDLAVGGSAVRVRVRVAVDGKPAGATWATATDRLFRFLDRDGDGHLSPSEAERLPTPFDLRRMLWGVFDPPVAVGAGWRAADAGRDERLAPAEVFAYYRDARLGVQVGLGVGPGAADLTAALVKALDRDRDGKVSPADLRTAEATLAPKDVNEDELIAPSELVAGLIYPGATGATRLAPVVAAPERGGVWLPASRAATAPDRTWAVAFTTDGPTLAAGEAGELVTGGVRLSLRVDAGKLGDLFAPAREKALGRFAALAGKEGLSAGQPAVRNDPAVQRLAAFADRDGDGRLTRPELDAWFAVAEAFLAGQILVTALDLGPGLFELLDADGDGGLSPRELRTAAARLEKAGHMRDGVLDPATLPRTVRLTVSRGHPRAALPRPERLGPEWFRAMDRNGDGDVSRREFAGPAAAFDKLDADGDGLLAPVEAGRSR